ncbi:hypothetical protein I4U23_009445 [Adineta vaga]|nr:hypothetical protein I4U23_009445 [Adineta vaga]
MKTKGSKKTRPQLYSLIASAIIPSASIVAVPSIAQKFPRQKVRANEEWGPMVPSLLRASSTDQLLFPKSLSLPNLNSQQHDDSARSIQKSSVGRMDPSSDEEDSDEDEEQRRRHRESSRQSVKNNITSQSPALSNTEKRLTNRPVDNETSDSTEYLDPKQALTAELSRSIDEKSSKRTTVPSPRQRVSPLVFNPVQSQAGPTSGRSDTRPEGFGGESKSTTTAHSSLNDATTVAGSARSVSFKEPVVHEKYDVSRSSESEDSTTVLDAIKKPILNQIVLPSSEDYQQNLNDLESRNHLLNNEVQQLRSNNQNLQRQYEELLERLQTSQKLSQQEIADILKQSGRDQTKGLEDLNSTLQHRCDQLQNELSVMKDRYTQSQNQSNLRELKNENHFLKDYVHRLTSAASDYQATHPPKSLKKEMHRQHEVQGLPMKGPSPIWLLNQKFLAPLFVCYDEKLFQKDELIKKFQTQLNELHEQVKLISNENLSLHERLSRSSITPGNNDNQLSDIEHIKRQAYLVLEENKVLQEQLNLQTNRLTDVQKTQIQEVSNLTRRLLMVESEKTESDQILETIRLRNEDLRRKYDQLMLDNTHRIHVQEHMQEISEMKRLTDELSEKHAQEMQLLLRRVQDAEAAKRVSHLKLTENRSDVERLKGEIKILKKLNKKLQLRVQTYEKKLDLEQVKEQRITTILEKTAEDLEQTRIERDTYLTLVFLKISVFFFL